MKGYGLDRKIYFEILNARLDSFGNDVNDDFQLMDCRCAYDDEYADTPEDLKEIDIRIIEMADELAAIETRLDDEHWIWHMDEISKGKYPLEKLPEHVQSLAKTLYY